MFERLERRTLLSAELQPDGTLLVTGTDADDNIRLFVSDGQIVVRDGSGDSQFTKSDVTAIDVKAGDGDDHVQLDPDVPAADLEGEAGGDTLIGGDQDDTLEGGAGNDHLDGKGGADVFRGGAGFDSADYRFRTEDLVITLNDAPDDGANGGNEGDNVHSDVERVVGGSGNDLIVGSDADNSVSPGDGNDTVLGGVGDDSLDGDGGDDWLIGEEGNDRLTGGPGQDLMEGRNGNDTFVAAQDGERDTLEGGAGTDTADSVDLRLDVVNDVENAPQQPSDGEITVLRGLNQLTDGKSVVDFGAVDRGDSASRTFTVRNDGTGVLDLSGVQVPDGFTLIEGLDGSLQPGQSDIFTIGVDTSSVGQKSGTVRISSDDSNENPFTFQILAQVQNTPPPKTPEITVLQSGSVIDDGQQSVGFGTVARNSNAPQRTFTVRNDGTGTLKLGNLLVPAGFTIVDDLVGSLAPGDSDQFTLRMPTGTAGSFSGQVRFTNNDSDENPFTFNVSGTVQNSTPPPPTKPEITILLGGHSLNTGAGTIKFGKATLNASAPTKTFTVRNDGQGTLSLGGVFVPRGFAVVDGLSSSLGAGQSDTFSVRMVTSAAGVFKGSVRVNSNDSNENPFLIKVNGSVGKPAVGKLTLMRGRSRLGNGSAVNFGNVARGASSKSLTFTIRNDGNGKLSVGSVRVPSGFILTKAPATTLAAHKSTTFALRMDTSAAGVRSGSVSVGSITFNVRGTVTAPKPPPGGGGGGGGGSVNASVDAAGTLIITGTAGNDSISVKGSGNSATVTLNGASKTFNGVKKIAVQAGEGNDTVNLSGIALPSAVDGRGGADTITGSRGADVLHGGAGNDSIVGGFGADQLFGDDGDDKLDAVDGTPDKMVDGGNGNDTIKADPTDSKSGT
jgi:hypothetical protein